MQTNKLKLNKLNNFKIIIFDLDDTLISISKYDKLVFKKICDDLIKDNTQKKKIFDKLKFLRKKELKILRKINIFDKVYVLDGNKRKFKPSTYSLSPLKKIIKYKKTVMIGDSKIDEQFAKNLKVKYIKYRTS